MLSKLYSTVANIAADGRFPATTMFLERKQMSNALHPNIAPVWKFVEEKCKIALVQSFAKHSLLSISRFHAATTLSSATLGSQSGLGSRDLRLRFIVYQLLQAVAYLHSQRLCLDKLDPSSVMLDDDMWLLLSVGLSERTCRAAGLVYRERTGSPRQSPRLQERKSPHGEDGAGANGGVQTNENGHIQAPLERPIGHKEPMTLRWVNGTVSNFEYLMAINHAAGRTMMDPLYHPIIPWVTDFSCYPVHDSHSMYGGLRDLTKTKFRLSKGDAQLETTYKHSDPPHHVPESLSELTYYIYLARRTPLQVLRRVVRDVFVPEHYPHSMGRIYDWTPDECIPEFYCDPTVLSSIHKDSGLHDIELPSFAPTPSEFIAFHRSVLESDEVSRKLHRWIDLTFGHCLEGQAAVTNMNVPLHHTLSSSERAGIDAPDVNKNPGFVMLFDSPHPRRNISTGKLERAAEQTVSTNKYSKSAEHSVNTRETFSIGSLIQLDNPARAPARSGASKNHSMGGASKTETLKHDSSALIQASELISSASTAYTEDAKSMIGMSTRKPVTNTANRKSFLRPPAEPSLTALRHAGDIVVSSDDPGSEAVQAIQAQVQQRQFADCFDAALGAVYELPHAANSGSDTRRHHSSGVWDRDFLESLKSVEAVVTADEEAAADADEEFLRAAQADDLLAVGCIVAELFTGRPLLNRNSAQRITDSGARSRDELVSHVYRHTADLPLVLRRIVAALVQRSRTARPTAAEILQACQKEDENRWTNKDFSLQRSGGCNAGYVNFQQLLANLRKGAPATPQDQPHTYSGTSLASVTQMPNKLIKYLEAENEKEAQSLYRSMRVELLSDYCGGMFPSYFRSVYSIVGELKLCRDGLVRMRMLLNKLDDILSIPLEGLNLVIRHILDVISDAKPFCDPPEVQQRLAKTYASGNRGENNQQWVAIEAKKTLIGEYHRIIDVIGMRLGVEATEKLLVPKVVDFLNDLTSVEMLEHILRSPLWTVLLLRSGVRCFLRCFLPLLLTYVSSGTLHHVSNGVRGLTPVAVPLWAKGEYLEYNMWLSCFPLYVVQEVEQAAMSTIVSLMEPECLGPGLCSRYMLPALLSLIGMPQLAGAGYGHSDVEIFSPQEVEAAFECVTAGKIESREALHNQDRPDLGDLDSAVGLSIDPTTPAAADKPIERDPKALPLLEKYVMRHAVYESQDRSVVRTVINLCMQLGDLVVSELILSKVFNSTLPDLVDSIVDVPTPGTVAALMEVVVLLNGILPSLCAETVQKDYLQPARISGMSLPKLLARLPLLPSWSITDDFDEDSMRYRTLDEYINAQRRHSLHFELCRLLASSSMMAGAETCIEHVIPSVDTFFKSFVQAFGHVPIESRTMAKGFELGAELFMPLAQLTGPEAFYTLVPNLNPRLEMWLVSVGSSVPGKSPPLPSNIWPEVTTEVEKEPRKKKGIMGWFSSRIIGSSTPAPAPPPAAAPSTTTVASAAVPKFVTGDEDYSPVAERTLQNARTAQSYSASIRKKQPETGRKVDIGQSPMGTELMPIEAQTPMFSTAQKPPAAQAESEDPYHLMNAEFGGSASPLARPPELNAAKDETEEEDPGASTAPQSPVPAVLVALPSLHADLEAEGMGDNADIERNGEPSAEEDDDASFVSLHSNPPPEDASDISPRPEVESQPEVAIVLEENPPLPSPVPDSVTAEASTASAEAGAEAAEGQPAEDHTMQANYYDVREAKFSRPYMSYQRLMASRRNPRGRSVAASKLTKNGTAKKGKSTSIFAHGDAENAEEIEQRELYYNEMAWLLGGTGRWNIDQDLKEKTATMQQKAAKLGRYHMSSGSDWNPAAQMSMTSPRMVTDAASDAGAVFALNMQCNSQWKLEETPGMIRCMAVNSIESMLLTCSRTGVRLWSLTSHPLLHISSYTHHSSPPFAAGFLRCGTNAATCDGNIHIWDVETRHTISFLSAATAAGYSSVEKGSGFTSMSIIAPRDGIMPSMGAYGDDQLITTLGATLSYHDLRVSSTGRGIVPVADWIIPQLPAPQGNFISSSSLEPLQLTCAASHDNYLFTGSYGGGMWIVDRRMGKVLTSWQAHEGPIMKVCLVIVLYILLFVFQSDASFL
jgi:hypothetical protein